MAGLTVAGRAGSPSPAACSSAASCSPTPASTRPTGTRSYRITHAPTLRAAAGSVLYLVLIALLGLGVATAIRDTAVSIGVVLGLLYLPPILAQASSDPLRRHIQQIAPMTAGLAIQATTNLRNLPIAPWAGLGVLAAWAAAALLVAVLLLRLRDA